MSYIKLIGTISILVSIYYTIQVWHYDVIQAKDDKILKLQKLNDSLVDLVDKTYSKLYICEYNLTTQTNNGFIEAIGEVAHENTSNLDNLGA